MTERVVASFVSSNLVSDGLWCTGARCASVDTQQTTTLYGLVETAGLLLRDLLLRGQGGALLSLVMGCMCSDSIRSSPATGSP